MTRFKKLSHSIYEYKYHIAFCPKYRYRILKGEIAEYTKQQIYQLCQRKDKLEVLELNVQIEHVHVVMSIPPKYAVSDTIGYLKGKQAIQLFRQYPKLKKRYWGQHLWARGYCVSTVGLNEEQVRKYVKWQEQKEKEVEAIQRRLID